MNIRESLLWAGDSSPVSSFRNTKSMRRQSRPYIYVRVSISPPTSAHIETYQAISKPSAAWQSAWCYMIVEASTNPPFLGGPCHRNSSARDIASATTVNLLQLVLAETDRHQRNRNSASDTLLVSYQMFRSLFNMCLNNNDSPENIVQPETPAVSGEVAAVWLRTRGVVAVQNAPFSPGRSTQKGTDGPSTWSCLQLQNIHLSSTALSRASLGSLRICHVVERNIIGSKTTQTHTRQMSPPSALR
jgi:hypothetical protein